MTVSREASGGDTDLVGGAQAPSAGSRPASAKTSQKRRPRHWGEIAIFVGPALLVFSAFVILPVVLAGYVSFFNWDGGGDLGNFVGFDNYTRVLDDGVFISSMKNNAFIVVMSLVIQGPFALGIALLMNRKLRFRAGFRTMIFVPYVLSEVVAGAMWRLILDQRGILNSLMIQWGIFDTPADAIGWLSDQKLVMWVMIFVLTWKYVGLAIILFLAGLQGVPEDLLEAAQIDGASWWQVQRRITIPLLGPTIRVWMFLSIIGSIQLFDMARLLTNNGAPFDTTFTMAMFVIDRAVTGRQYGYATAAAVILFAISLTAALLFMRFVMRRDNETAEKGAV
ncbi:sugar ABC transporter permease [Demequina sp. TTPB684]|uniref:carbohydrate ABC transporter permease n=1 Tax=unclassified Demequina TaxID=2620311 RepID=UPI001CF374AE|nr:sugar ABC transporter permease [Demequina sp. TMPB413]MCB2413441.1 sugar ABC transporter permease [Demequina sp. TTPB684]UPU88746.1 sugar ABC transporter permease [Demequina sp. TMPB413]